MEADHKWYRFRITPGEHDTIDSIKISMSVGCPTDQVICSSNYRLQAPWYKRFWWWIKKQFRRMKIAIL